MPYIDYKETIPGVKSDFSVMELDQRHVEIIRASLNNSYSELVIRKCSSQSSMNQFSTPHGLELMQIVSELCVLFNGYASRPATIASEELPKS